MKTVMKKLLSLALVAILLVSAVPFQASAATVATSVDVDVYVNDKFEVTKKNAITVEQGTPVVLTEELAHLNTVVADWTNRTFDKWVASEAGDLKYEWLTSDAGKDYKLSLYIKETKPAHVHSYAEVITTAATCTEKGVKTVTCANTDGQCDKPSYTVDIPATGHSWGDWSEGDNNQAVRTCKNGCQSQQTTSIVKFYADDKVIEKMYLNKGDTIGTLPTAPQKLGYNKDVDWYSGKNGTGTKLLSTSAWDGDTYAYYAKYVENPDGTKDGLSYLTIRMRLYTGSTQTNDVLLEKVELADSTNILQWLNQNEARISNAIFDKVDATKYEWTDRVYYNNDTKADLTSQATLADGDKTVFVKVHAVASTETNVQLYIHQYNSSSKSYSTLKIVDVGGYKAGDTITLTKMATVVKKYYSYKSINGLYTDSTWKQLVNGQNPTASTSITVSDGKTVKYHVILTNASTVTSSSKADTSNPKTGDMIFVPMMVMLASAAAVAFVYTGSKKRTVR